ncbi:MAG: YceI family protein [Actinomycetota bacterium]
MILRAGMALAALFALFLSTLSGAASADTHGLATIRGACEASFLVSATFHDVSGSARCLPFEAVLARDAAGRRVIPTVEVDVPVAAMATGNKTRDGKMREMFESDRYPQIHAAAHDVDVERLRAEMGKGRDGNAAIDLLLRIHGVERKVRAAASDLKESGERVGFVLEFPVSLREFDLKPPSVLGILRVGDEVSVKTTFSLTVPPSP